MNNWDTSYKNSLMNESRLLIKINAILNIIFLVKGIKIRNPIKSVKNPGVIKSKAAIAIEAPDKIS